MNMNFWRGTLLALGLAGAFQGVQAQYIISTATDVFAPSFRGSADSTYYGWDPGSFDAAPAAETSPEDFNANNGPAPTLGSNPSPADLLRQTDAFGVNTITNPDIISSTNNIHIFSATRYLTLRIDTNGSVGSGFTTIIVQGTSLPNADPTAFSLPSFGTINGVAPTVVTGTNLPVSGQAEAQWWAKYELTGNLASYDLLLTLSSPDPFHPLSIGTLTVDTKWSASGYAPDTAQAVPEPSTYALVVMGLGVFAFVRYRRKEKSLGA